MFYIPLIMSRPRNAVSMFACLDSDGHTSHELWPAVARPYWTPRSPMEEIRVTLLRPTVSHVGRASAISAIPDTNIRFDSESDRTPHPPVH